MSGKASAWLRLLLPVAAYVGAGAALRALLRAALPEAPDAAAALPLLPAAWLYARRCAPPGGGRPRLALAARYAALGLGLGLLTALAARWLGLAAPTPTGRGAWAPAGVLAVCVAGPLGEELIYRGVALRRGEPLLGRVGALLLSAALFAAGHAPGPRVLLAFAAGLAFGRALQREGTLLAPAACHIAANVALLLIQPL